MSTSETRDGFEDVPILAELRDLLEAHFQAAEQPAPRRRRSRWFSGRVRGIVIVAALLASGATASALLVKVGSRLPARPNPYAQVVQGAPPHVGPTPREAVAMLREIGTPLPATARAYTLQPDPVGGPPWGVLVYRTTTGLICEHAGRVVAGYIGLLDLHGQLHPWPADASGCTGGTSLRAILAQGGRLDEGGEPNCGVLPVVHRLRGIVPCVRSELRTILEGVLPPSGLPITGGPRSTPASVTFITSHGSFTERTPEGAFVYVIAGAAGIGCKNHITATVTYADGRREPATGMPPVPPVSVCRQIASQGR